jgi:hypothetical protein
VDSGNQTEPSKANYLGLVTSVISELHYDAIGIGTFDLLVGEEFFKQTSEHKLTVLDASPGARGSTLPYFVKSVDGVKVGVVSFGAEPANADTNEYARRRALYSAFKAAREASDILIVLDQANLVNRDWAERNGKRLGLPDVVIPGVDRSFMPADTVAGKTHLMQTSRNATHVGVVDIEIAQGQEPKYTIQRIALEKALGGDEAITKRVNAFLLSIGLTPTSMQQQQSVPVTQYYHPATCRGCHVKEYDDWAASKHARAVKTLVDEKRTIPECMNCHSEVFRRVRAVSIPPDGVGGVDCITCHSGSLPHGMERARTAVRVKVDPRMCVGCHTPERSGSYEEKPYMAKISHRNAMAPTTASSPVAPPAMK